MSDIVARTSQLNKETANNRIRSLLPELKTEVLSGSSPYWIGRVALLGLEFMPEEYRAARILRANVYIDEQGFLPESARDPDGGEHDQDDDRSIQFAAIEKVISNVGRVIGTSRLIVKRDEEDLLPVEKLFPEAFQHNPAPINSVEASRFIALHPDRGIQRSVSLALMRTMSAHGHNLNAPLIYAVTERKLARRFLSVGLPLESVSDYKSLDEYGGTLNMATQFNPVDIFNTVRKDKEGKKVITSFFNGALVDLGVGYYDASFVSGSSQLEDINNG